MADFPHRSHWQALSQQLSMPGQAFIDGRYTDATSGARFDCISPIDGRVLAAVADCDAQDVERAVLAARRAFDAGHWSQASPAHRKRVLLALAALVEKHADELALLETPDMGKPVRDARRIDLPGVVRCWPDRRSGGQAVGKSRRPAHTSWGWSRASLPAWWRRSCHGISVADGLLEDRAGTGDGQFGGPAVRAFATVGVAAGGAGGRGGPAGRSAERAARPWCARGEPLALHMDVDVLAFTGSTATGAKLLEYAGRSNLKRVWLECGGKSPHWCSPTRRT